MKNKKLLFLIILFLSISFVQTAFAAPQIYAYIYDASTLDTRYPCDPKNPNSCTYFIGILIEYNLSSAANQGGLYIYTHEFGNSGIYCGNWYPNHGACGWASGEGTLSTIQATERTMLSYGMYLAGNFTNPDNSITFVQSNIAQVINPINAPIGSPFNSPPVLEPYPQALLTSLKNSSLTNDPINIATGEDYSSSIDFELDSHRGMK